MELAVKLIDISTGDSPIVLITRKAALTHDLHTSDRVTLSCKGRSVIASVNTTVNGFGLHDGQIGIYQETALALGAEHGAVVQVVPASKPESIQCIRKKI